MPVTSGRPEINEAELTELRRLREARIRHRIVSSQDVSLEQLRSLTQEQIEAIASGRVSATPDTNTPDWLIDDSALLQVRTTATTYSSSSVPVQEREVKVPNVSGSILKFLLYRSGKEIVFAIQEQNLEALPRGNVSLITSGSWRIASSGSPELERQTIYIRGDSDSMDEKIAHTSYRTVEEAARMEIQMLKALFELPGLLGLKRDTHTNVISGPFYEV